MLGLSAEQSQVTVLFSLYSILGAPVIEEVLFRGYLVIENRGRAALWAGVVGISLLFALLHPFLWKWKGEGLIIQVHKYNGNPIGVQLPPHVELTIAQTEPGVRGDSSGGNVTKPATLETGLEIRVPLFIKEGERVKVSTETREFVARA